MRFLSRLPEIYEDPDTDREMPSPPEQGKTESQNRETLRSRNGMEIKGFKSTKRGGIRYSNLRRKAQKETTQDSTNTKKVQWTIGSAQKLDKGSLG